MIKKFLHFLALFAALSIAASCAFAAKDDLANLPSWYVKPKQNNADNLYGIAEGYTMEEATKYALAEAASRLMVSISSQSDMIREENQNSVNEEIRQQVRQNVEKIDFSSFKVSKSEQVATKFYVEVEIQRTPFLNQQQEKSQFLAAQIADLEKDLNSKNPIQKRNNLLKILDLSKQDELVSRILNGAGLANSDLKAKLARIAKFQNQLNNSNEQLEFFFDIDSPKEIAQAIRSAINKEQIKIAKVENSSLNQVKISIKSNSRSEKIYGAFITKLSIDFENISQGKTVASNSIEVTGNSVISEQESYSAAIAALKDKIQDQGILNILGIIQ